MHPRIVLRKEQGKPGFSWAIKSIRCACGSARTKRQFSWRGRLRRQRYGSKKAGTYHELPGFYVRIYHQGRGHAFTLQTLNEMAAATQARDYYLAVLREGWGPVLRRFRSNGVDIVQNPTVGQFLTEISEKAGLRARTFRNYANCLRTLISEIFKIRTEGSKFDYRGNGNTRWREKIDAVRLSRIKSAQIQAWKVARLKAAGESPIAQRSAKRTINSYQPESITHALKGRLPRTSTSS